MRAPTDILHHLHTLPPTRLLQVMQARHSVRSYTHTPLPADAKATLGSAVTAINGQYGLHIQLVTNEPKAFTGMLAYGKFSGVTNYFAMIGPKTHRIDERVGYCGEQLVLLAQLLGLNTCWVGLSYRAVDGAYCISPAEKLACMIAVGYGTTRGKDHRRKTAGQVSNISPSTPAWFRHGVEAALLAPTAINQQRFRFEYAGAGSSGIHRVKAHRGFSMVGYTHMDLGIAKLHFELGAGNTPFEWA